MCEPYPLNFYFSAFHVWWRDDLNGWRVGGGENWLVASLPGGEMTIINPPSVYNIYKAKVSGMPCLFFTQK